MFGYLTVDNKSLSKDDTARYRLFYCGLCRSLYARYGAPGRNTLTYDMTFLAVLLSSLYTYGEERHTRRCVMRPLSRGAFIDNTAVEYAADMNILLAYHQQLDDWNDDHNRAALRRSKDLQAAYMEASARRPRQTKVIEECLAQLTRMESANELNADTPANCFGTLLGEVFASEEDDLAASLRDMGAALGRFIYLLDAANDLRADIKRERYNPLVAMDGADIQPVLLMLMGECTDIYEKLPVKKDTPILRNVLYSGVWTRYHTRKPRLDETHRGEANDGSV